MNSIVVAALILQALVPALLIVWIATGRRRPRVILALDTLIALAYVAAIALAGLWLPLPHWLPVVYALLVGFAAVYAWRTPRSSPLHPIAVGARAIALAIAAGVAAYGFSGYRVPPAVVDLSFPLVPGDYLIGNGGMNTLVNAHIGTLGSDLYRNYRGQSYAVDIVGVGRWGSRRRGDLAPRDPAAYAIYGTPVIAPCAGSVIVAVDGRPDMPVPVHDRTHLEGNHVILSCGDLWVVLAHMRPGSVRHQAGASVRRGDVLGEVGNSGNTDEPHLHVHVQRAGSADAPLSGEPVPVRFDNLWLTRNKRITD